MSCGCKKILTSAVAFVFFFPRYHFHSVLFQFCAAIISCATDWKGWKCLISYLGLFCFFKHYNLDHKVRNSLNEVFVLRVIPLYDFSSLQTFKNSLHGRMPLKAPCSETDVLGGRGGMLVSRLVRTIREKCAFMTSRVLYKCQHANCVLHHFDTYIQNYICNVCCSQSVSVY